MESSNNPEAVDVSLYGNKLTGTAAINSPVVYYPGGLSYGKSGMFLSTGHTTTHQYLPWRETAILDNSQTLFHFNYKFDWSTTNDNMRHNIHIKHPDQSETRLKMTSSPHITAAGAGVCKASGKTSCCPRPVSFCGVGFSAAAVCRMEAGLTTRAALWPARDHPHRLRRVPAAPFRCCRLDWNYTAFQCGLFRPRLKHYGAISFIFVR